LRSAGVSTIPRQRRGERGFVSDTRAIAAAAIKVIGMTGISPPHASAPGTWDV
jgi:hypothetical protein